MTLRGAAAARVRLIVWCLPFAEPHGFAGCRECRYQVEPDPAEMARRYGPETPVPEWRKRLVCSQCGSHHADMVVTGERR
jgi:hypothetical protein